MFSILLDNLSEFAEPLVEWRKVCFVVDCGLVHMTEDLLWSKGIEYAGMGILKISGPVFPER